jgi:hypothetical protein
MKVATKTGSSRSTPRQCSDRRSRGRLLSHGFFGRYGRLSKRRPEPMAIGAESFLGRGSGGF